jgi:amino acid transporter
MAITILWMILAGLPHFDRSLVFNWGDWSEYSFSANLESSGVALGLAMYTYFGYYQVCYLGDEVLEPTRTIPRSIFISVILVALAYLLLNLVMVGAIPWPELASHESDAGSVYMGKLQGKWAAALVTCMILWTAAAGAFAAILGYARVPYAAARSGHFFRALAATHSNGDFPHRSLLLVAGLSMLACLADLETLIKAIMTSRILIQFVGQIGTVVFIRTRPELRSKLTFRMWLYPVPAVVALVGWLIVFVATDRSIILYGLGSMLLGVLIFSVWDIRSRQANLDSSGLPQSGDP